MLLRTPACLMIAAVLLAAPMARSAHASARDVGLGVAGGLSYSPTKLKSGVLETRSAGNSFSWGFFVDIPLLETFYIAPAAMLYQLDFGNGMEPVTDIDLNFKFIIPMSSVRLGAGFIVGLTSAELKYTGHYGALGYLSYNLVSNIDLFIQAQYKKLMRDTGGNVDDLHGYLGCMFHF